MKLHAGGDNTKCLKNLQTAGKTTEQKSKYARQNPRNTRTHKSTQKLEENFGTKHAAANSHSERTSRPNGTTPRMNQTSMGLSSEAVETNAAAGFEFIAERFYSGIKEESTATTLLL